MKKLIFITIATIFLNYIFPQGKIQANPFGNDLLNENPVYPIPEEMTFDEYKDMNRRLGVGLLLSAIPFPGTIHSYAGEPKTAKKLRWLAGGSLLSIVAGIMSFDGEGDWQKSSYELHILNEGEDDEKRFEMIPVSISNSEVDYTLKEIYKESEWKATSILLPIGMGMLISGYLYDYIYGIKTIEEKRDKVRFKYGKKLDFSFEPSYDFKSKKAELSLAYRF